MKAVYEGPTTKNGCVNGKTYEIIGVEAGLYRVIDEAGYEDGEEVQGYLYNPLLFRPVDGTGEEPEDTWSMNGPDLLPEKREDGKVKSYRIGWFDCPCCGSKHSIPEDRAGEHGICTVCGWEDDAHQSEDEDGIGANPVSLKQAREDFKDGQPS